MYTAILLTFAALPPQAPLPQQAPPVKPDCVNACGCGLCNGDCLCGAAKQCSFGCLCVPANKPVDAAKYEWRVFGDGTQAALLKDGKQCGAWRFSDQVYRPYDGRQWGDFCEPPVMPPKQPARPVTPTGPLQLPVPAGGFFSPECVGST